MPRLVAATPKYRRHKSSGQAVVTVAGKDHYLGPYKSKASKVEYDRVIGEWLAAGRPVAPVGQPHQLTVLEIAAAFWRYAKAHYRKNGRATGTAENYRTPLSLLRQRYGHTLAIDFGPLALKALRQAMVEDDQCRRYANENTDRVRRVFRWAASEQMIPASVPESLRTVEGLRKGHSTAREPEPVEPVQDSIVEATLPHLPAVVADMVRLQRLTGARPGEVCRLRSADVDRSSEVWRYVPVEHKTEHHGKRRTIFIGPKAQAILLPYLLRDAESHCFVPSESEKQRRLERHERRVTPLTCGNRPQTRRRRRRRNPGNRYSNGSYRRAIARGCEIAFGMPDRLRKLSSSLTPEQKAKIRAEAAAWRAEHVWHPNQLRHSAATDIRHTFGIEAVQVVLGHSRINTSEIYTAKNTDLAERVVREVG
jgi:integrase